MKIRGGRSAASFVESGSRLRTGPAVGEAPRILDQATQSLSIDQALCCRTAWGDNPLPAMTGMLCSSAGRLAPQTDTS